MRRRSFLSVAGLSVAGGGLLGSSPAQASALLSPSALGGRPRAAEAGGPPLAAEAGGHPLAAEAGGHPLPADLAGRVPAEFAGCPVLVVAADGTGDFTGVQAAVNAAPTGAVIAVRPGTYLGAVAVPAAKTSIALLGLGARPSDVVIADDRANGTPRPDGGTWGTSGSASVTVDGAGFRAHNLTFANLFDEAAHPEITSKQAVAVLTRADRMEFTRVRFVANQDTLYVNSSAAGVVARAYFRDCYVEGDVDFIFGRATAVFDRCRIHSLNRGTTPNGYVTAPSTDRTIPYGLLLQRCALTSNAPAGSVLLGRPWHPSNDPNAIGQTIIRESSIGAHIGAAPWSDFGTWPWREARFAEYHNRGAGAAVTVDRPQLTNAEAARYTAAEFLRGSDGWQPQICR